MTQKPPTPKRKVVQSPVQVDSDPEDRSPPREKLVIKKRHKHIPAIATKTSGTSKPKGLNEQQLADEKPPKVITTNPVIESHNSSPDHGVHKVTFHSCFFSAFNKLDNIFTNYSSTNIG